jgi:hypothetical protein
LRETKRQTAGSHHIGHIHSAIMPASLVGVYLPY